jgi:hypothetical protein
MTSIHKNETKKYQIRLPTQLLQAAKDKAREEDVPLAQVFRHFLRRWTEGQLPTYELLKGEDQPTKSQS